MTWTSEEWVLVEMELRDRVRKGEPSKGGNPLTRMEREEGSEEGPGPIDDPRHLLWMWWRMTYPQEV